MKYDLGLKLYSVNDNYIDEALKLYEKEVFGYIELYSVPGSLDAYVKLWKGLDIPFVIHAPHFREGVNLAKNELEAKNIDCINEARRYADELDSDAIILHPGIAGDINETVRQINILKDRRFLIENKPYYALDDGLICNGASPEEIKTVIDNANTGFCLDIGHAICAANGFKLNRDSFIDRMMSLKPSMFHLTDGISADVYDKHLHFGKGDLNIKDILRTIPDKARITIETIKDSKKDLNDFEKDVKYLKRMF